MSEPFLELQNVAVGYGRHVVLQNINLKISAGSFTGLLGTNGSGKSTLVKTILGIIPPLEGKISFAEKSNGRLMFGYVPQGETFDPIFLVSSFEVVLMAGCGRVGPGRRFDRTEKEWAQQCLTETGANAFMHQRFSELSGGQKQRVLIARALATKPDFLVLDEPTAGIDAAASRSIMELLQQIHQKQSITILMVNHDLHLTRRYVQEVIWLHHGNVLQGTVGELLSRAKIEEILDLQLG